MRFGDRGEKLLIIDADNRKSVERTELLEERRTRRISSRTACRHGDDRQEVLKFDLQGQTKQGADQRGV